MKNDKLYAAADRAVNQALRIRKGEKYLLVTDTQKLEIAEALAFYAKQAGAEVTTYLMTETLRPITGRPGSSRSSSGARRSRPTSSRAASPRSPSGASWSPRGRSTAASA